MSIGERIEAGSAIHKLVDKCDKGEGSQPYWSAADTAIRSVTSPQEQARLVKDLENTGLLPRLMLDTAAAIDANGDHKITRKELQDTINDTTGKVNAATKLAAQYELDHFNEIDKGGSRNGGKDGCIDEKELKKWQKDHPGDTDPNSKFYYNDDPSNPNKSTSTRPEDKANLLNNPQASAQEKLKAAESMGDGAKVEMTDKDGNKHTYTVQVSEIGNGRKYVHLYDEKGNIVLRGIDDNGNIVPEKHGNNKDAGYGADSWKYASDRDVTKFDQ